MIKIRIKKTNWAMTPLGLAREILYVDKEGNIIRRRIERKKRNIKL